MNYKNSFISFIIVSLFITLSSGLGISGQGPPRGKEAQSMYKQLMCALDRGPCDTLGHYIKSK